ncbi:MAG TPA: pyridoxine 5'-phosphate synthase [Leptospiraceae bacterium]|nr:pyridoxine 5'-phosphate synthase [Leptospiraceae bacterium]HMY69401.1 pyridoxine 5'-phosphate synthase [Leptospiraceae bacterium]HMZ61780.1 pyridoxine 5'-phosphate synthase [Leptospiraceae bacterium]HNF15776.1 pyridoxine 5'-phosphate synthase [Leptospiraceae bacterium]HNF25226.1 pyridoxine 5'-phosphate synthase [Leptospiraceae bacterium]
MTKLSVNVNKIATLRNSRGGNIPDLMEYSKIIMDAGVHGITVHPREDERHIRRTDVFHLKKLIKEYNGINNSKIEYNIEGEPSQRFRDLVLEAAPDQVTLVPVTPGEITSDHGFQLKTEGEFLSEYISIFKKQGIRVSIFMETDAENIRLAKNTGTDRIELYTGPFAENYSEGKEKESFEAYRTAAEAALSSGLGINAGHDLDTENLKLFRKLPGLLEVSIGHRLMSRALLTGLKTAVREYLEILSEDVSHS